MQLYFLRHGLADWPQWDGLDAARPLTTLGKERMLRQAKMLSKLKLNPDAIISSPLMRARQTAEILARGLGVHHLLHVDERLSPSFGTLELNEILTEYPGARALIFVGHEPDFSQTISALIGGGSVVCKKGGLARVDLTTLEPPHGELVWLLPPKVMDS